MKTTNNILIRKVISLPILGLFILLITGCNNTTPTIFSNPICAPPCWENIEPGITSKQDAFNLVSKMSTVDKGTVVFRGEPTWIFDDILYVGFTTNEIVGRLYIVDEVVMVISFSGDLGVSLEEAFEQLGEPEFVINLPVYGGPPLRGSMSSSVQLLNSQVGYGLIYENLGLSTFQQNKISPDIKISTITYFYPDLFEKLTDAGFFSFESLDGNQTRQSLIPWNGYGDLEEKYPQIIIDNQ